jgi:hypothetical protein
MILDCPALNEVSPVTDVRPEVSDSPNFTTVTSTNVTSVMSHDLLQMSG